MIVALYISDNAGVRQGVHIESVFELVWLNQFTVTGFKEPLAFTLFIWNWFRLHMITYLPVEYRDNGPVLVAEAKMMLLHCAKNHHFVLASIQAASTVVKLFSIFARLSRYSQTSFNSHRKVSWV